LHCCGNSALRAACRALGLRRLLAALDLGSLRCASPTRAFPHSFAAVKCIKKAKLTKEDLDALNVEVQAMKLLDNHPNFVQFYDFFSER
jgi:hypothetical protein